MNTQTTLLATLSTLALSGAASAQVTFSTDYMSPLRPFVNHGDILMPVGGLPAYGPMPPPLVFIPGGAAGLGIPSFAFGCVGAPAPVPCPIELDALSYGTDFPLRVGPIPSHTIQFSVDEFAVGIPPAPLPPDITSESAVCDSAADIFGNLLSPAGILPPAFGGSTGVIDGNGLVSGSGALYPGVGLIEPNCPVPGPAVDGDNLDAYDFADGPPGFAAVFFSLDAAFFDPLRAMPNTGSGPANGFPPGAVLATLAPGGPPIVYAPPPALGLDFFGPMTDDLDALALFENGIPGYMPSPAPYVWGPGTAFDMLLFSVRRGSAVIGSLDSNLGLPIVEGDILIPPVAGGGPFPGILITAESLGLATTRVMTSIVFSDDLDALDTRWGPPTGTPFCSASPLCPCGNIGAPGNGCGNNVFATGGNLAATGVASVSADSVVLTGTQMPNGPCLYFQGTTQVAVPFGDGVRCVAGAAIRIGIKFNVGNTSSYPVGVDPPLSVAGGVPAVGGIRHYQCWYRDANPTYCTIATFNLTNGLTIGWTP